MPPFDLYPHQTQALEKITDELARHKSTLLASSVGTGKTIMYLMWLLQSLKLGQRALVLAHRRELIYQPMERMQDFFPALHKGAGIVMGKQRDVAARVVVATVQSLVSGNRLGEILAHGKIDYLVTDESHHGIADTYERVYDTLYAANPNMLHLGCTATPRRADEIALKRVFESVAFKYPLNQAIADGVLVPFVALGVYVPTVKLDHIPQFKGDWSRKGVGTAMSEKAVLDTAVETWKERAEGRPTIAFCATVEQAHRMAQWFCDAGVSAEAADYRTKKDHRAAILRRFERGETTVICNALLWTEGVDLPMAEVGLMLRPTQSDSLYIQMIGRLLRTWKGKESALIVDFVPASARNMVMAGDVLDGVPKPQRKVEEKAEEQGVLLSCLGIDRKGRGIDADVDEVFVRVLNYLNASTLAWTQVGRLSTVGLSDTATLVVVGPDEERLARAEPFRGTARWNDAAQREYDRIRKYYVYAIEQDKDWDTGKKGPRRVYKLGAFGSWDDSVETTEQYALEHEDRVLAKRKKRWRRLAPTAGQVKFAHRLGIKGATTMRRGELAQAITHKLASDLLRRKGLL